MNKPNRLYYFGTDIEVKEGDHIIYKTLILRKKQIARVSYIPELTANELTEKSKFNDPDFWLIEFSDNNKTTLQILYSPEDLQPSKKVTFISRKNDSYKGINSKELESSLIKQLNENPTSWLESIFFSLIIIGGLVGIGLLLKWLLA